MFIKTAYENRVKKELQESIQSKLGGRQKIHKIGSIKNTRRNYDKDEQFFSSDDVPLKAKKAHDQIVEFIDPDILELRKKQWNSSVLVPKNPIIEETFERKLIKIKLGLMDQPVPVLKDKIIPPGCDTRNDYTNWNVSVEQNLRERQKKLLLETEKSLLNTKLKENIFVKTYIKPIEVQMELTNNLRKEKTNEKGLRDELRKMYTFQNPTASKEKADGAVYRLAYETKLIKNQKKVEDPSGVLGRPDLSKTLKQYKTIKYIHTGVWKDFIERKIIRDIDQTGNEVEKSGKTKTYSAWSCCMNQDENSEGCHQIINDKFKWNFTSP